MEMGSTRRSGQNCGAALTPVIGTAGPPLDPKASEQATGRTGHGRRERAILMRDLGEELDKPLLFVDIDGVISLFGFPPGAPPAGTWTSVDGVPHLISAAAS